MFAHGEPVTVLSAGFDTDPYSDDLEQSWEWSPTEVVVPNVLVADGGSVEPLREARNSVESDFDLVFQPPLTVVPTSANRVVVRGLTCEVVGRPFPWRWAATGGEAGMIVRARIVEG